MMGWSRTTTKMKTFSRNKFLHKWVAKSILQYSWRGFSLFLLGITSDNMILIFFQLVGSGSQYTRVRQHCSSHSARSAWRKLNTDSLGRRRGGEDDVNTFAVGFGGAFFLKVMATIEHYCACASAAILDLCPSLKWRKGELSQLYYAISSSYLAWVH